jgi:hypothetical protein
MSVQLHRHRRGVFEDFELTPAKKAEIIAALDALLDSIQSVMPRNGKQKILDIAREND